MRTRTVGLVIVAGVFALTFACIGGLVLIGLTGGVGARAVGDHVAIVPVRGLIVSYTEPGPFGTAGASAERLVSLLDDLAKDDSVRAVVLQIDSPGGGATASREIFLAVERVRASGKPVVAWYGSTAASGAYYISASADRIIAMPGTITGSIGVIAQVPLLAELFDKIGVEFQTVKSGEFKDMLSPDRPLTDEEREILEAIIMETYDEFVAVVAEGRGLPEDQVRELADGRIFTGRQAQELGLVDELGDFPHAVSVAGELAGLGPDPTTRVYRQERGLLEALYGFGARMFGITLPPGFEMPATHVTINF